MNAKQLKCRGVFVTATDTSVGKTTVAAGLAGYLKSQGFNVGVMKPVASGAIECESGKLISQDAEMLVKFSGTSDPWEWINPYCLAAPVNPALAARIEGVAIDFEKIHDCFLKIASRHDFVVVEGAGGAMTPVFENRVMADLIQTLNIPALVVARAAMGTINHTLMTFECLKTRAVPIAGFFINRFPEKPNLAQSTSAEIIASISNFPLLGAMRELGDLFSQEDLVKTFAAALNLDAFMDVFFE